jgi:hypothetical protein
MSFKFNAQKFRASSSTIRLTTSCRGCLLYMLLKILFVITSYSSFGASPLISPQGSNELTSL